MGYVNITDGLTLQVPTLGTKNWYTNFYDNCLKKISSHDHTGSGKGLNIGTTAISNLAVTAAKLAADAVTTTKILDGAVTTAKLGSLSIGASQLAADSVTTVKILDLNVTAAKLAADSVTTAKILDANVTLAKIANIATSKLLGRATAGSGVIEELSLGASLSFSGTTLQRAALTGDVTAAANGNATTIANNAVTTAKILAANVTAAKISWDATILPTTDATYKLGDGSHRLAAISMVRPAFKWQRLTAAGTTQGTATAITGFIAVIDTVTAGNDGVLMPTPVDDGETVFVRNNDAADQVKLYPHSGSNWNGLGVNAYVSLSTLTSYVCWYDGANARWEIAVIGA